MLNKYINVRREMLIFINIDEYHLNNVIIHESVRNTIKQGCLFMKVNYSTNILVLSGIYLNMILSNIEIKECNDSICRIKICTNEQKVLISKIVEIEDKILNHACNNKTKITSIANEILRHGSIKMYHNKQIKYGFNSEIECILRIYGVWYDDKRCGLNYQLIFNKSI
jgi:hypothetical protein